MTKRIEYLKWMMPTSGRLNPAEIKKLLKKVYEDDKARGCWSLVESAGLYYR